MNREGAKNAKEEKEEDIHYQAEPSNEYLEALPRLKNSIICEV